MKDAFGRQGAPASLSELPLPKYLVGAARVVWQGVNCPAGGRRRGSLSAPPTLQERPWRGKTMPDDALARGVTYQGTGEALKRFARWGGSQAPGSGAALLFAVALQWGDRVCTCLCEALVLACIHPCAPAVPPVSQADDRGPAVHCGVYWGQRDNRARRHQR